MYRDRDRDIYLIIREKERDFCDKHIERVLVLIHKIQIYRGKYFCFDNGREGEVFDT